jgi:hypothetical protein
MKPHRCTPRNPTDDMMLTAQLQPYYQRKRFSILPSEFASKGRILRK